MSREYKHLTGIELIKGFCTEVISYGLRLGLDVTGVKMLISPKLKDTLELGEFLDIDCQGCTYNVPVITENIKEVPMGNGKFQSDIYVGDPEWETDLTKGEIGFKVQKHNGNT